MSRSDSTPPFPPEMHSPGLSSNAPACLVERLDPTAALLQSLQSLRRGEALYRQSCISEEAAILEQLGNVRLGIQKLQDKLLVALEGDFESQESTACIHRELGLLLDVEKSLADRSYEVREQVISSSRQELQADIDTHDHIAKLGPRRESMMEQDTQLGAQHLSQLVEIVQNLAAKINQRSLSENFTSQTLNPIPPFRGAASHCGATVQPHHVVPAPFVQPPAPPLPSVNPKKQYHAFLTHNWGDASANHERVKQICHALKSMGLNLWFDEERLGANVIQEMTSGIDQSDVVVVFVTKTYCLKIQKPDYDNCKIEFMYAVNRMCSMMVAVPLDEDVLLPQSWSGPVGAILGCNLYPAKFWDNGAITPQRPEFAVQVQKLYDRIVSLCEGNGDGSSSVVSNSPALPASGVAVSLPPSVVQVPFKRSVAEIFVLHQSKLAHRVALHACATSPSMRQMLENNRKWSRDAISQKILKNFDSNFLNACNEIIDLRNDISTDALTSKHFSTANLKVQVKLFFAFVHDLASLPHTQEKTDLLISKLRQVEGFGKPYKVACQENVGMFHAFMLAGPRCVASDDVLVVHGRQTLLDSFLKVYDKRGWTMSSAFQQLWLGCREMNEIFADETDSRTKRCFGFGMSEFFTRTGLKPDASINQIAFGDCTPYFDLLVFIKALGDLADSEVSHKGVWDEVNKMFDTLPPLMLFKDVVGLVRRQNEWSMNIPGTDANEQVKLRYSARLLTATSQLQRSRNDLKASDPAALALWDRATQHPPLPTSELTLHKLHDINLRRQLDGLVKIISFFSFEPPVGNKKAAHDRLVFDLLEVLQDIHVTDWSGRKKCVQILIPVIKQALAFDDANVRTCTEVAQHECSGDDLALLFANQLDESIRRYSSFHEHLQADYQNFLLPLIHTVIGQVASSDMMQVEVPVDPAQAGPNIRRAAELCFPKLACSARANACSGGQKAEKMSIIGIWKEFPGMRQVLESLWREPSNLDAALSFAKGQNTRRLARLIHESIKKLQPKNTIAGCLSGLSILVQRIAELRDEWSAQRGNMRICSGGIMAERREFFNDDGNHMIQFEEAGIKIRPAISALWNGERNCAVLISMCSTFLEKLVFRDILNHVEDRIGPIPDIPGDLNASLEEQPSDACDAKHSTGTLHHTQYVDSPRASVDVQNFSNVIGSGPLMISDRPTSDDKKDETPISNHSDFLKLSDEENELLIGVFAELGDSPLSHLKITDIKDFRHNAACITLFLNAQPPRDVSPLLQRFAHAQEMCKITLEIKSMAGRSVSCNRALRSISLQNLEREEKQMIVAVCHLMFLGVTATPRVVPSSNTSIFTEIEECSIMEHFLMLSGTCVDDVFSGSADDHASNAFCIATAVRDQDVYAQLRSKLLTPFRDADKMFEVIAQLKDLLDSKGSRPQAMHAVTSSGLEGNALRTLAASVIILFGNSSDAAAAALPAAAEGGDSSGSVQQSSSGVAALSSHTDPVAPVRLQAPSVEMLQKLRSAVLAMEDDSLEDLEISADTGENAVRRNSATIFVLLRRDSDFSRVEPRLASLLSSFEHSRLLLTIFQSIHADLSSSSAMKRCFTDVLSDVSLSSTGLLLHEMSTVANVASLIYENRSYDERGVTDSAVVDSHRLAESCDEEAPRDASPPTVFNGNLDNPKKSDAFTEVEECSIMEHFLMLSGTCVDDVFSGSADDHASNAFCIATAVRDQDVYAQLRSKLLTPFRDADKMFEVIAQLKDLLDSKGSRPQAMHAVTSSGLEGNALRTLAASVIILFGNSSDAAAAALPAAAEGGDSSGSVQQSSSGVAALSSHTDPVAPVRLQAPSVEMLQKLRSAVLAMEDDSLEDLEISADTGENAVRRNSATIFVLLRRDSDFSRVEPRLASLLSAFSDSSCLCILFRQIHELNSILGSFRLTLFQVIKRLSLTAVQQCLVLSDNSLSMVANCAALFFS
jgi:hypothetical protein